MNLDDLKKKKSALEADVQVLRNNIEIAQKNLIATDGAIQVVNQLIAEAEAKKTADADTKGKEKKKKDN